MAALPALPSFAAKAVLSVENTDGYARLVYAFDRAPSARAEMLSGVLVVSFDDEVAVDVGHVASALPDYVTAARRDPDGRATRFALGREVRLNVTEAGERLFVDLLPASWRGLPPPLPRAVIEELTERSRKVDEMRAELDRLVQARRMPVGFEAGTHPAFTRLIFLLPEPVDVAFGSTGGEGNLVFDLPLAFDPAVARAAVSPEIVSISAHTGEKELVISLSANAHEMRGFREDDTFVVDILKDQPSATLVTAGEIASAPAPEGQPAADASMQPANQNAAAPMPAVAPREAGTKADADEALPMRALDVAVTRGSVEIDLPYGIDVPAALFARGKRLFLVFDSKGTFDPQPMVARSEGMVRRAVLSSSDGGQLIEIETDELRLASLRPEGDAWTLTIGEASRGASRPLTLDTAFAENGRAIVRAQMQGAGSVHWIDMAGGRRAVVTARPPTRSILRPREFVEFRSMAAMHGLVIEPIADDVAVKVVGDAVEISRDEGLTVSVAGATGPARRATSLRPNSPFEASAWRSARANPQRMANELLRAASQSEGRERTSARVALARHHLAAGNAAEANAVLDVARADAGELEADANVLLMRGSALVMLRRFDDAIAVLGSGALNGSSEAALWRMMAEAALGRVGAARLSYEAGRDVIAALPEDLQALFGQTMVEVAIAAGDLAGASGELESIDRSGIEEGRERRALLRGRIAEAQGQSGLALDAYAEALTGEDEIAAAEARFASIVLRHDIEQIDHARAMAELEGLTTVWRGDQVEADGLAALSRLYAADARWRDAFATLGTLSAEFPAERVTVELADEMQAAFTTLFLGEGEDAAPLTLDSLALFYDFKSLAPQGRRGDAMIRRLADRLVAADLLEQAADLLEYQIAHRLAGAARAQVAANAAIVHLMNRKPARAQLVLDQTRIANLPKELLRRRLMLEARALAELSRTDLALELVEGLEGDDIVRLRADALWHARRWQAAAEMLELGIGDGWRGDAPLGEAARDDVLRAAIGYALAGDAIGTDRMRAKFGMKMAGSPDVAAFDLATQPVDLRGADFREIARAATMTDTLDRFIAEYKARYPQGEEAGQPGENSAARREAPAGISG